MGTSAPPGPDPAKVATAVSHLQRATRRRLERQQQYRDLAASFYEMPLEDVRGWLKPRHFEVALMHLGGYAPRVIAQACGYAKAAVVEAILQRPEVARYVLLIKEAQEARVIAGEFGVRAAAKAAAPKAMNRIATLAIDGARKDADTITAGKVVLQVAGELVERHEHHHVVELMRGMSRQELVALSERDEWPARLVEQVRALGLGTGKALPAPRDDE